MTMRYHHSLAFSRLFWTAALLGVEVLLMMTMMPAQQQVLAFVVPAQITTTTPLPKPAVAGQHLHKPSLSISPPSPSISTFAYEHHTGTVPSIRSRRSTQLHGTLGITMSRLASSIMSSSLRVRIAALFLTGFFGLWWVASKALKKHSIKFDGGSSCSCPLFQTTTTNAPVSSSLDPSTSITTTSQSQHGFSGFAWPPTWWSSSDMRLAALQLLGRRPMVHLKTQKLISEILVDKEFIQTLALPTHNNGLIATTDGNRHAYLRRLLEQAFCPQTALHEALPAIQQVTSRCWESKIAQQQQQSGDDCNSSKSFTTATMMQMDLHDISLDCVLDTILCHYLGYPLPTATTSTSIQGGKAQGQDHDDDNDKNDVLVLKEILKTFTGVHHQHDDDNNKKKLRFLPWGRRRLSRRQEQETKKNARAYLKEKIKSQMMAMKQQNTNDNDQTASSSSSSSSSVLSQLIWAKETTDYGVQTLTDEEILDSMLGLIVAATSSTTQVMTSAMEWLGRHPKHYAQLVQEQRGNNGSSKSPSQQQLNYDMLDEHHAPILNVVVEEVLRLHSNTDNLLSPRLVTEEIQLSNGQTIRKGWLVKLEQQPQQQQQSTTTNIPQDTNNKEVEEEKSASAASLSPFGEGPRACLGQSLAILQIKVFLVMLARNVDSYEIEEVANSSSSRMDKVVLNNNNTRGGGILLPVGGGGVEEQQQQQQNEPVTEYTTTATASWMRDALETSPNAFE